MSLRLGTYIVDQLVHMKNCWYYVSIRESKGQTPNVNLDELIESINMIHARVRQVAKQEWSEIISSEVRRSEAAENGAVSTHTHIHTFHKSTRPRAAPNEHSRSRHFDPRFKRPTPHESAAEGNPNSFIIHKFQSSDKRFLVHFLYSLLLIPSKVSPSNFKYAFRCCNYQIGMFHFFSLSFFFVVHRLQFLISFYRLARKERLMK